MSTDIPDEIITKEPDKKIEKTKDPKKVAAGKRLAEYHKKAKQALKQEMKHEDGEEASSKWVPSLTTGLALIGIGLTAVDLYFRWKKNATPTKKPNEEKTPEPNTGKQSPVRKSGMD